MKKTVLATLALISTLPSAWAQAITPDEARGIAKDAYVYGYPLVDNYRVQYSYFVDRAGPEYKAPWNTPSNTARVYTPADTAIQTPNSDTPYSFIGADLRAEPLVFSVPAIEKDRYAAAIKLDHPLFSAPVSGLNSGGQGFRMVACGVESCAVAGQKPVPDWGDRRILA